MTNPFSATGYDVISMTQAINKIPNEARYIGKLERLGLFRPRPIITTNFAVEEYNGVLNLLTSQPRGGPVPKNVIGKRKMRNFNVPHYPLEDVILASEIQGVRAFGSETATETEASVMARKLGEMRRKHDLTREWLRMCALKGIIVDGDGTTLYNLFTEFGLSQSAVDMELDDATVDVNSKVRDVVRDIMDALKGDTMNGVYCLASRTFYDHFVGHAKVQEAFKYYQTAQNLAADFTKPFTFAGITIEEFDVITADAAGTERRFCADGYAYAFPMGTNETFVEVIAPADFLETVNTPGLPFYAKQEAMDFNRGTDVHTQMNILPFCTRPEVLQLLLAH